MTDEEWVRRWVEQVRRAWERREAGLDTVTQLIRGVEADALIRESGCVPPRGP